MPRRSITVCANLIFIFRSTIYACELEAHVKRCNETKTITTQQQLPFYSCDYCLCDDKSDNLQQASYEKGANHLSKMIAQMQQAEWDALVQKVEQLFLSCFGTSNVQSAIKTQIFPLETCAQLVKEGETQKEKHLVQQACLFGHLKECNMFDMNQYVYAEFGCGKSELSYRLCQVATMENAQLVETLQKKPNANAVPRFVGIDRSTFRKKCDGPIRSLLNNVHSVQRILIDIKDLNLNLVPALHAEPVVVISKHLCGIATDLTLRCLAMAQQTVDTRGLFICLCCHHCCTWKSYASMYTLYSILQYRSILFYQESIFAIGF